MWHDLRKQLVSSPWLHPTDDLNTQRGIIATSIAILDRMSNGDKLREVSWQPARLAAKTQLTPDLSGSTKPQASPSSGPSRKVRSPVPPPHGPRPGGAAVQVQVAAQADILF